MKLQEFKDYVKADKVFLGTDDGVFVGTQNYFFAIPSKMTDHSYSKITTTKFSFKGKEIHEAVQDVIQGSDSVKELEKNMLEMNDNFEEMKSHRIDDLASFSVQANLLGSQIYFKNHGDRLITPFIQRLGKQKKEIKAFYANHSKLK